MQQGGGEQERQARNVGGQKQARQQKRVGALLGLGDSDSSSSSSSSSTESLSGCNAMDASGEGEEDDMTSEYFEVRTSEYFEGPLQAPETRCGYRVCCCVVLH
jgi:hypothetical protein